jgi:hypothetical protein
VATYVCTQPVYNAGRAAHALRSDQNNSVNSGHYVCLFDLLDLAAWYAYR